MNKREHGFRDRCWDVLKTVDFGKANLELSEKTGDLHGECNEHH